MKGAPMPPSESDIDIVHDDGTVTDKRDGVRRPMAEHLAHVLGTVPPDPRTIELPALELDPRTFPPDTPPAPASPRAALVGVALGVAGGSAVVGVAALVHFIRW